MNHSTTFTLQDWINKVEEVSSKYSEVVDVWEIWNEPQFPQFQYGYQDGTAGHYFSMLKTAYEIIKINDPEAPVLGMGGAFVYGDSSLVDFSLTASVMALGGGSYMDGISLHTYGENIPSNFVSLIPFYKTFGKELWMTEYGQASRDGDQSSYIIEMNNNFDSWGINKRFYYILRDEPDGYGLITEDGYTKPSYSAFRELQYNV